MHSSILKIQTFIQFFLEHFKNARIFQSSQRNYSATMKVLIVGATGNMGLRLVAALLTHNHSVVAFVRSASKLESLLPASVYSQISVVQGNATDSAAMKRAILDAGCDAVINAAGLAAVAPWAKSDLPQIFRAVANAVLEAGLERKKPLRAWFLGGMGVLNFPGSETMLSN
jgi:putative NADH-flavin reductase